MHAGVIVNVAGVHFANDILGCSEEEWDLRVGVDLKGTYLLLLTACVKNTIAL